MFVFGKNNRQNCTNAIRTKTNLKQKKKTHEATMLIDPLLESAICFYVTEPKLGICEYAM